MSSKLKGSSIGGFNLLSLNMFRFMNYQGKPTKLSFNHKNIVISGPTGSGKTTILDALTFALFGRNSRLDLSMVKTENICGKNGRVDCKFKIGKRNYHITRGRDKNGKSFLELFIDKYRVNGKIPELNEKIRSTILGMNYISFIHSTIIRQDEMKSLGSRSSAERLKILQNLFRLDIFDKAIKDAQDRLTVLNNKMISTTEKLNIQEEQLKKIPNLEKNIEDLTVKLINGKKSLLVMKKEHKELLMEKNKQNKKNEEFQDLKSKMEKTKSELKNFESSLKKTQEELKRYLIFKMNIKKLESDLEKASGIDTEIHRLEVLEKDNTHIELRINDIKGKLEKDTKILQSDILKKSKQIEKINSRLAGLTTDIDYKTAFKILNQEGRMLERINRISLEKTWELQENLIQELIKEQDEAKNELDTLLANKKNINIDSFRLSEIKKQFSAVNVELKSLKERYDKVVKQAEKELKKEEKKQRNLQFDEEAKKSLKKLKIMQRSLENTRKVYSRDKKEFEDQSDPTSKLNILETQIKGLKLEISKYQDGLIPFKAFIEEFKSLERQIEEKKEKFNRKEIQLVRMDQDVKNKGENLAELKKVVPEVKKLRKKKSEFLHEENLLIKLKDEVFHIKGAPFYAINKILPRLGKKASYILSDLTNQRFKSIQLQKIEKGKQNLGFEINIQTSQGPRDIATFSGGERTQINAALRLAISEELSSFSKEQSYSPDYLNYR
ncbi:MAG: AAA family ATPase [Candidatus Hodarchaeales archaeon]